MGDNNNRSLAIGFYLLVLLKNYSSFFGHDLIRNAS